MKNPLALFFLSTPVHEKVVRKADVKRRNQAAHTMAERRIMASVRHPFVVPLLFAFQTAEKLYMVPPFFLVLTPRSILRRKMHLFPVCRCAIYFVFMLYIFIV